MSLVGIVVLDGLAPPAPSADDRREASQGAGPFVRIAGVELVTRQLHSMVQGGAERVLVLPGRHRTRFEGLVARDARLRRLPLEVRYADLPSVLQELGERSAIVAGPQAFFGPGVARAAATTSDPATVDGLEIMMGPARALAAGGTLSTHGLPDERDAYACTVASGAQVRTAKRHIFRNVSKKTSGWVSRNINSLLSIPTSYVISELPITPNMITIFTTVVGLASAVFVAFGDALNLAIGGVLFQLAAALDRVDGEIARSKFQASKRGAWIDTVGDNLTYLCFVAGLTWGLYRASGQGWVVTLGGGLLVTLIAMLLVMYGYLRKYTDSGSLVAVTTDMEERLAGEHKPLVYRALDRIRFVGKRDFFSLAACVVLVLGRVDVAFFCAIGVVGGTIAYFASAATKAFRSAKPASLDPASAAPGSSHASDDRMTL
jgi:phosphatidylglycerophosphate synthase